MSFTENSWWLSRLSSGHTIAEWRTALNQDNSYSFPQHDRVSADTAVFAQSWFRSLDQLRFLNCWIFHRLQVSDQVPCWVFPFVTHAFNEYQNPTVKFLSVYILSWDLSSRKILYLQLLSLVCVYLKSSNICSLKEHLASYLLTEEHFSLLLPNSAFSKFGFACSNIYPLCIAK